jgi:hypothetical protein
MAGYKQIEPHFKKGESGNPNGRPKGVKNRSTLLKKWIEVNTKIKHPITKKEEQGTVEDMIVIALLNKAMQGDIQAIKEINDTLYGKIVDNQKIDLNIPNLPNVKIITKRGND